MTIPVIKCLSLKTSNIITIPSRFNAPREFFLEMERLLTVADGVYRNGKQKFCVHTTENYKYCAAMIEEILDQEGRLRRIEYDSSDVERYCRSIEEFAEENNREIVDYAHDVQYFIGALVHKSVVRSGQELSEERLRSVLEEINVLSAVMSAKDSYFRYNTDSYSSDVYDVSVTGKFFKISKGAKFIAESQSKRLNVDFSAPGPCHIRCKDVFDFIPYLIIENAIKYSPADIDLGIEISKVGSSVRVEVESFGPLLEPGEEQRIFERGYRGVQARRMVSRGHGTGLYQAARALKDLTGGTIAVEQYAKEYPITIGGIDFVRTAFILSI